MHNAYEAPVDPEPEAPAFPPIPQAEVPEVSADDAVYAGDTMQIDSSAIHAKAANVNAQFENPAPESATPQFARVENRPPVERKPYVPDEEPPEKKKSKTA